MWFYSENTRGIGFQTAQCFIPNSRRIIEKKNSNTSDNDQCYIMFTFWTQNVVYKNRSSTETGSCCYVLKKPKTKEKSIKNKYVVECRSILYIDWCTLSNEFNLYECTSFLQFCCWGFVRPCMLLFFEVWKKSSNILYNIEELRPYLLLWSWSYFEK